MNVASIKSAYKRYGFILEDERPQEGLLAFLLITGPFRNVEIIKTRPDADAASIYDELVGLGYSCKVLESSDCTEARLFESFFSVKSYREKIKRDYFSFARSISKKYSDSSEYKYLSAPYLVDGIEGHRDVSEEILERLEQKGPTIFVVEAAAGYGKTCAAYELTHRINDMSERIPLLAELSRNRQARIFKHVLLDEIDRSFPSLSSSLIKDETASGRVVIILDGFDELLRDNEVSAADFDSKEPMLETIGEYLKGGAKIILTTRRTMLFEGDGFHNWVESNKEEFSLVKIQINEPKVNDWLDLSRRELLESSGVEIKTIANPVLLSFLRYISDEELLKICESPEALVDSYFDFILERERVRQDLIMTAEGQNSILDIVAHDMIAGGYKSEDRSYIMDLITSHGFELIEQAIDQYPIDNRPTVEELANKLASHAFLDRSSRNPTKIEFINEFVFGHYVARDIVKESDWISDDWRYLESAILSYKTRSPVTKRKLWDSICMSLDFVSLTNKISASLSLLGIVDFDIRDGEVNSVVFKDVNVGDVRDVSNAQFNGCQFSNCTFFLEKISGVSFFECKFFGCNHVGASLGDKEIFFPGCVDDNDFIRRVISSKDSFSNNLEGQDKSRAEAAVLEKFWPVGRETITHKHRPIRGICTFADSGNISPEEMYEAITTLKKRGVLSDARSSLMVEINLGAINEIKSILRRV